MVGLATFARSQYLVFDFDTSRIGFGGLYSRYGSPDDDPNKHSVPGWAVFLVLVFVGAIIAILVYLYLQLRKRKLEQELS